MIKPLATLLTIWGSIMLIVTFFLYLNSPVNIDYNDAVKYSMVDSGVAFSFFISIFMTVAGIALLKLSKVPRRV